MIQTEADELMRADVESQSWRFLFELQWWHGERFVQRFHAWDVDGRVLWELAWPLFELQQSYKRYLAALRDACSSSDLHWIEPTMPPETAQTITQLRPRVEQPVDGRKDALSNCMMMTPAWHGALRQAGIPTQHIRGAFNTSYAGEIPHEFLLVGDREHVFDPTAGQFGDQPHPSRYVVEPGDTDDEPGYTLVEYRADNCGPIKISKAPR